jgi:hypothetical protein
MRPTATAAALLAALLAGAAPGAAAVSTPARVLALLADRTLVVADAETGTVLSTTPLGPARPTVRFGGDLIGRSPDGRMIYVLVPGARLAVVEAASLRVTRRVALPSGVRFTSLAVGPRTGRLYLSGNTSRSAQVDVLSTEGTLLRRAVLRPSDAWLVLSSAIAPDESALYVSYHGGSTTGADRLRLGRTLTRCRDRYARGGCLSLHGSVRTLGGELLATTGEGPLLRLAPDGRVLRRYDLGLEGNHVMEFAVSGDGTEAAVLGSCGYAGGLSLVDLGSGARRVVGRERKTICGERVAYAGPLLAIARNPFPVPQGLPAAISLVERESGTVARTVAVQTEAVDLAAD